jgi:hypothetical protein
MDNLIILLYILYIIISWFFIIGYITRWKKINKLNILLSEEEQKSKKMYESLKSKLLSISQEVEENMKDRRWLNNYESMRRKKVRFQNMLAKFRVWEWDIVDQFLKKELTLNSYNKLIKWLIYKK